MKVKLIIIDDDHIFVKKIVDFLYSKHKNEFEIRHYENIDIFRKENDDFKYDLIWVNEENIHKINSEEEKEKCIFLSESNEIATYENLEAISKYFKPTITYKKLLLKYAETTQGNITRFSDIDKKSNIVVFSSIMGGVGKTALSIAFAKKMILKNKKVLYLNFNAYADYDIYMEKSDEETDILYDNYTLSDLFIRYKKRGGEVSVLVDSLVQVDTTGLHYFNTWKKPLDAMEISNSEFIEVIEEIRDKNIYDLIIIDDFVEIEPKWFDFIESIDQYYLVFDNSIRGALYLEAFNKMEILLSKNDKNSILDKIQKIANKSKDNGSKMFDKYIENFKDSGNNAELVRKIIANL